MRISDWSSDVCSSDLSSLESMRRVFTILIAIAALGSAGWFGIHAFGGSEPLASVPIPIKAAENLPDTPAEWRGRIDYAAPDRQLTDLSQRPQMAGRAVAGVAAGEHTLLRAPAL